MTDNSVLIGIAAAIIGYLAKTLAEKFFVRTPERIEERLKTLEDNRVKKLEDKFEALDGAREKNAEDRGRLTALIEKAEEVVNRLDMTLNAANERIASAEAKVTMQENRGTAHSARLADHVGDRHVHCKYPDRPAGCLGASERN